MEEPDDTQLIPTIQEQTPRWYENTYPSLCRIWRIAIEHAEPNLRRRLLFILVIIRRLGWPRAIVTDRRGQNPLHYY